jgi:hypothetical protein
MIPQQLLLHHLILNLYQNLNQYLYHQHFLEVDLPEEYYLLLEQVLLMFLYQHQNHLVLKVN